MKIEGKLTQAEDLAQHNILRKLADPMISAEEAKDLAIAYHSLMKGISGRQYAQKVYDLSAMNSEKAIERDQIGKDKVKQKD